MKSEIKLTRILSELTGLLKDSPELKPVFDREIKALQNAFSTTADAPPRPTLTKPLWGDVTCRRNRNPAEFIREEYKAELSAGTLTRAGLRMLDKPLYDAYANWITPKRHPEDDLGLPKAARTNLDELNDPVEHVRKQRREIMRRWRSRIDR